MPHRRITAAADLLRRHAAALAAAIAFVGFGIVGYFGQRASKPAAKSAIAPPKPLEGVTVVLDPGHGGEDSGAVCRYTLSRSTPPRSQQIVAIKPPTASPAAGASSSPKPIPAPKPPPLEVRRIVEATVNYRMASVVASALRAQGAKVVLTVASSALIDNLREGDRTPEPPLIFPADARLIYNNSPVRARASESPDDLYRRAAVAQQVWRKSSPSERNSLYFLSLHCDKLSAGSHGRGARVYRDKRDHSPPLFAAQLKKRLTDSGMTNSAHGMVIPREYGVLNAKYNPISERVLLEAATISDRRDCRAVLTPAWRWKMAHIIADAMTDCERSRKAARETLRPRTAQGDPRQSASSREGSPPARGQAG